MMNFFSRYMIGGRSGKREQAWLVFLLWCGVFGWFVFSEGSGVPMPGTQAILTLAFPVVMANLAAAYGMEWLTAQTRWGGGPEE